MSPVTLVPVLGACGIAPWVRAACVSEGDAALGMRAALKRGAAAADGVLGRGGGFLDNPEVRIEPPRC